MEKILERVQKLLNLAGNNPNEAEATAAIEKAHALLAEHNLTLAAVQAHGQKVEKGDRDAARTGTNFSEKYYGWIWSACAQLNYCFVMKFRPDPKKRETFYTVVGRKVNTIVATQMAMYLCQTINRLANEAAKEHGRKDFAFKNAFIAGCANRLHDRLLAMKAAEVAPSTGGNALAIWSGAEEAANMQYVEQVMKIKLKLPAKARPSSLDFSGVRAGSKAADRVSLDQQVGKASEDAKKIR